MSIFKKREQNRIINQDETTEIPVYGPHATLCAQNYKIPYLLASIEYRFEEKCRDFAEFCGADGGVPDLYVFPKFLFYIQGI